MPSFLDLRFAGDSRAYSLSPHEVLCEELNNLRPGWPPCMPGRFFYRLSLCATLGHSRVVVALSDEEKGMALFQVGQWEKALPFLRRALEKKSHPTMAVMALIAAKQMGQPLDDALQSKLQNLADLVRTDLDASRLYEIFGVHGDYLRALPYWSAEAEDLPSKGFEVVTDYFSKGGEDDFETIRSKPGERQRLATHIFMLEPGAYDATFHIKHSAKRDEKASVWVILQDGAGRPIHTQEKEVHRTGLGQYADLIVPFEIPPAMTEGRLVLYADKDFPLSVDHAEIAPDPIKTLELLQKRLELPTVTISSASTHMNFNRQNVMFDRGIQLEGYRCRDTTVERGGLLGLNLYWSLTKKINSVDDIAVWIHVVDQNNKKVFQGDHRLLRDLSRTSALEEADAMYGEIKVPEDISPGVYKIRMGLYHPGTGKRFKVAEPGKKKGSKSVELALALQVI